MAKAVTATTGAESVWWNPAGLAGLDDGRLDVFRGRDLAGDATSITLLTARSAGTLGVSYLLYDLGTVDLRDAPCGGTPGFSTRPGGVAHWPGGLALAFPGKNCVQGRIVMAEGDMNLTFKDYLRSPITFEIENDYVTQIIGTSSQTLEEAFKTAVRVRRAEKRALTMLAERKAALSTG